MALTRLSELLQDALAGGYALGYFEAWDTYSMEAVVEAAEEENSPVVIGFGGMMMERAWLDQFGIEPLAAYGKSIAQRAQIPAAFILNEVWELDHAQRGACAGFNTVMLNTCHLSLQENTDLTRRVVEFSHSRAVEVQAELGRLPDFGREDPGRLTDPDEAREFVKATGVDFLAVSIGNVHLQIEGKVKPDLQLLKDIHDAVDIPLVIHGGSGFPDHAIPDVIQQGVALFHLGTVLKKGCLHAAQEGLAQLGEEKNYQALVGSRKPDDFLLSGKETVKRTVKSGLRLYGSSGRACVWYSTGESV